MTILNYDGVIEYVVAHSCKVSWIRLNWFTIYDGWDFLPPAPPGYLMSKNPRLVRVINRLKAKLPFQYLSINTYLTKNLFFFFCHIYLTLEM